MRRTLIVVLACLVLFPVAINAQQRKRTSKTTSSSATSTAANAVATSGAQRVSDQIKLLSRFLYLLGGVAKGIESADAAAQRGEATQAIIDKTKTSKDTVKSSIQNFRVALDELEIDFRTKPELQRYYTKLVGSASGAAAAEELANKGQFDQAGRSLLQVVNRLTDVLFEMRR